MFKSLLNVTLVGESDSLCMLHLVSLCGSFMYLTNLSHIHARLDNVHRLMAGNAAPESKHCKGKDRNER